MLRRGTRVRPWACSGHQSLVPKAALWLLQASGDFPLTCQEPILLPSSSSEMRGQREDGEG